MKIKLLPTVFSAVIGGALVLSLPAMADETTPPDQPAAGTSGQDDPLETYNRTMSGLNRAVRGLVLDPLVDGYQAVAPDPLQTAISNVVSNLSEPATAISSLLQGDTDNASTSTQRFFVNTTVGLGGTSDPATDMGLLQRREDLGQALAVNGAEAGPHVVIPLLGPSNFRDLTGDVITGLVSPLPLAAKAASAGVSYADNQDDINAVSQGAMDPYVVEKEAYEQHRRYEVLNGAPAGDDDFPTLTAEDMAAPAAQ